MDDDFLLQIDDLVLSLSSGTRLLDGVSFEVAHKEVIGVVGESGSGKSLTAMSIMRLLPDINFSGKIIFSGEDLTDFSERQMRKVRGAQISMVFQDPMTAFLPVRSIGAQIDEQIRLHNKITRKEARERTISLLGRMGVPDPHLVAERYPYQLSGGLRQRAMIAMALSCSPDLIIADEPTTALDVTVQAQILNLFEEIREQGAGIMLITHDIGVVAQSCSFVVVMYSGVVVETGSKKQVLEQPLHPYTQALLATIPPLEGPRPKYLQTISGLPPSPSERATGCVFASRCSSVQQQCEEVRPELLSVDLDYRRRVACVLYSA